MLNVEWRMLNVEWRTWRIHGGAVDDWARSAVSSRVGPGSSNGSQFNILQFNIQHSTFRFESRQIHECPSTACGRYGSSRNLISSSLNVISSAAMASSR